MRVCGVWVGIGNIKHQVKAPRDYNFQPPLLVTHLPLSVCLWPMLPAMSALTPKPERRRQAQVYVERTWKQISLKIISLFFNLGIRIHVGKEVGRGERKREGEGGKRERKKGERNREIRKRESDLICSSVEEGLGGVYSY